MTRVVITLLVMGALFSASWFVLPVTSVAVAGNAHLSEAQVSRLANSQKGAPWLWVQGWRAEKLLEHPWVESAQITRTFPNRVRIDVTERTPLATHLRSDGSSVALAADGTVLPNTKKPALTISGWGSDRVAESLQILIALKALNIKKIEFTPQGFTLVHQTGAKQTQALWTDSFASLLKHGGSVKLGAIASSRVSVYPWGVTRKP
jgi:cell division protein FtsQ